MTAQPDRRRRCKLKETWPILRRSGTSELIPEVRYKPIYRIAALYLHLNHPLRGSNSRLVSSKMPTARVIRRERMSRNPFRGVASEVVGDAFVAVRRLDCPVRPSEETAR